MVQDMMGQNVMKQRHIKLGCKGLLATNTQAYQEHKMNNSHKKFCKIGPRT
jgi:hypothetical protein